MTQKLYLDRSYETVFEAAVVSSQPTNDGATVVLDRTLFYPESGGQLADTGSLGGADVINVQEGDRDTVVHTVRGPVAREGTIQGTINWDRRFDHMQQHTGQHILSRAFIKTDRLDTVSFHMGEDTCTIDIDGSSLDAATIRRAEDLANQIVQEDRPIDIATIPIEQVDMSELRRKVPEGVRDARIVTVRDFDVIPCCGTHVRTTGELGIIKVLKSEKVKGYQRVHFKVGNRAYADYRDKHAVLTELSQKLTTAPLDVAAKVQQMMQDSQAAAKRAKALIQRLATSEAERLVASTASAAPRILVHRESDAALARALATELQKCAGTISIIAADDGSVVCVSSHETGIDLATPAGALARELGGSGGGKGGFAQAKVDPSRVDEFMQRMAANVRALL
ncbi:MAG TPA: alanyl-tRNA editing protein [Candidatus Krumholzibacteria bacterium]